MTMKFLSKSLIISSCLLVLSACSLNSLSVRLSSLFIEQKIAALNSETDLQQVKKQLLSNIKQLEQMILIDKKNQQLHLHAAQAYYSYAFAFVEDNNRKQATSLYYKSYEHARTALTLNGLPASVLRGRSTLLRKKAASLPVGSVDALYWTAVSWARLIEIKQPDILLFTQLHKTAILMEEVIKRDESCYLGGPYLFFAVYYGSRPRLLGGNDQLASEYFERARQFNHNKLLIVDYLQAKYLKGRVSGNEKFNQRLLRIIKAPDDLYPEQALMNAVVRQKASRLLFEVRTELADSQG